MLNNLKNSQKLFRLSAAALLLSFTLIAGDTQCRELHPTSIDHVYEPQQTQTQPAPENKDYLQQSGQMIWLAPWNIPEYESAGSGMSRQYTFPVEDPAAKTATVTGSAYLDASAIVKGETVTLELSLTEAGRRLLVCKKEQLRITCGDTSATVCLWLIPQDMEIPPEADNMPVNVNQICKKQTRSVHLQDGKACLLLGSANRNTYILTFLDQGAALQGLRYSLDNGKTYVQLYDWNQIYLPLQAAEDTLLILDYSLCGITTQSKLDILLERQNDETHQQQKVSLDVENAAPGDHLPRGILVTPEQAWSLPVQWNGCDYSWQICRLTKSDGGTLVYTQMEQPNGFLVNATEQALEISVQNGENRPEPGTYQLILQWKFEGVVCGGTTVAFFVNYPLM